MSEDFERKAERAKAQARKLAMRTGKAVIGKWDEGKRDFVLYCEGKPVESGGKERGKPNDEEGRKA